MGAEISVVLFTAVSSEPRTKPSIWESFNKLFVE